MPGSSVGVECQEDALHARPEQRQRRRAWAAAARHGFHDVSATAAAARPSSPPTSPTCSATTRASGLRRGPRPPVRRSVDRAAPAPALHDLRRAGAPPTRRRRSTRAHRGLPRHHESGSPSSPPRRIPARRPHRPAGRQRIIEAVRSRFDYVVIDTPAALTEVGAGQRSTSLTFLYTMATLDLPSVRNMGVFLGTLDRLKISNENIRLILNKPSAMSGSTSSSHQVVPARV